MANRSQSNSLIIFLLIASCLFINIITLKNGHNWGGDFAQYIIHAQNIVAGKLYTSGITLDLQLLYPPGFPLIIAPFIKLFGVNFIILKSLNILFWYLFVLLAYKITAEFVEREPALLFAAFLAASAEFFTFKQNVLSDVPFAFFVFLSIFLMGRYLAAEGQQNHPARFFYLTAAVLSFAFTMLVRSAGAVLFAAAVFYLLFIKRAWRQTLLFAAVFLLTYLWQRITIGNNPGFFSSILEDSRGYIPLAIKANALAFKSILWFISPGFTNYANIVFTALSWAVSLASPFLFAAVIIIFTARVIKGQATFLECFSLFYLLMLLAWSGFPASPRGFARYIYPLLPAVFIALVKSVNWAARKISFRRENVRWANGAIKIIIFAIILLNIYNITLALNFNDDVLFKKENREMFAWVERNISPGNTYMSWRARTVALITGKVGTTPWVARKDSLSRIPEKIAKYKVGFVIVAKESDKFLEDIFARQYGLIKPVWENAGFKIFKLGRDK